MKSNAECKVSECNDYRPFKLVDEDAYESRLKDVSVEEKQKKNDHRKQNADVLNSKDNKLVILILVFKTLII